MAFVANETAIPLMKTVDTDAMMRDVPNAPTKAFPTDRGAVCRPTDNTRALAELEAWAEKKKIVLGLLRSKAYASNRLEGQSFRLPF